MSGLELDLLKLILRWIFFSFQLDCDVRAGDWEAGLLDSIPSSPIDSLCNLGPVT